jgi:ElaB/YqjD/DUF883 family membrane-anchored ribosome-binding protein
MAVSSMAVPAASAGTSMRRTVRMETVAPESSRPEDPAKPDQRIASSSQAGQEPARLRVAAGASWRAARARLARVGDDVRIEARSTAHAAERYARQKPWQVAAAAATVAFLAGLIIGVRLGAAGLRRQHGPR